MLKLLVRIGGLGGCTLLLSGNVAPDASITATVPGPIVGAGLPALGLFAIGYALMRRRRRR